MFGGCSDVQAVICSQENGGERLLQVIGVDHPGWNDQPSFYPLPLLGCHNLQHDIPVQGTQSASSARSNKLDRIDCCHNFKSCWEMSARVLLMKESMLCVTSWVVEPAGMHHCRTRREGASNSFVERPPSRKDMYIVLSLGDCNMNARPA